MAISIALTTILLILILMLFILHHMYLYHEQETFDSVSHIISELNKTYATIEVLSYRLKKKIPYNITYAYISGSGISSLHLYKKFLVDYSESLHTLHCYMLRLVKEYAEL